VTRGQKTANKDFANGRRLLSMEKSDSELVWSSGDQLASDVVAKAFGLEDKKELLTRSDASPFSPARSVGIGTIIVVLVILLILLSLISRCSRCDPRVENCSSSSSRSSGGSFGGFSGGGGHK
jgi:hypothetical protein